MKDSWYLLDTGWACGGIHVKNNIVIESAPIFRKFLGQNVLKLFKTYKIS